MSEPKPEGWAPVATAREALDRVRDRMTRPTMSRDQVEAAVDGDLYRVVQVGPLCRVFRLVGGKWKSGYVRTACDLTRVVAWLQESSDAEGS